MSIQLPILDCKNSTENSSLSHIPNLEVQSEEGASRNFHQLNPNCDPMLPEIRESAEFSPKKREILSQPRRSTPPAFSKKKSSTPRCSGKGDADLYATFQKGTHLVGWRMSVPNCPTEMISNLNQHGHRRFSLNTSNQPLLALDFKHKSANETNPRRKISNILPIQFLNNFSNVIPGLNKQTNNSSPEGNVEVIQEEVETPVHLIQNSSPDVFERIDSPDTLMKNYNSNNDNNQKNDNNDNSNSNSNNTPTSVINLKQTSGIENSLLSNTNSCEQVPLSCSNFQSSKQLDNSQTKSTNNSTITERDFSTMSMNHQQLFPMPDSSAMVLPANEIYGQGLRDSRTIFLPAFESESSKKIILPPYSSTPKSNQHKRNPSDTPRITLSLHKDRLPPINPVQSKVNSLNPHYLSPRSYNFKSSSSGSDTDSCQSATKKTINLPVFISPPKIEKKTPFFPDTFLNYSIPTKPKEKRSSFSIPENSVMSDDADLMKPSILKRASTERRVKNIFGNKSRIKEKSLKRVKIIAVTKEQRRLKQVLWAMVLPLFLIEETNKSRRKSLQLRPFENLEEKVNESLTQTTNFIKKHCSELLYNLYKEGKSMVVASNEEKGFFGWRKLETDDISKRAKVLISRVKPLLDGITAAILKEGLPEQVQSFLKSISDENSRIPQNYLFQFELSRLRFNRFGELKNVTTLRSKMILGMFVIVRVLLNNFLAHPWDHMSHVSFKGFTKRNLKSCTSVLYHLFMEMLTQSLKVVPDKHMFATLKSRLQPKKEMLYGFELTRKDDEVNADAIITGLYARKKLRPFFISQSQHVQDLKQSYEKLLSALYFKVRDEIDEK